MKLLNFSLYFLSIRSNHADFYHRLTECGE